MSDQHQTTTTRCADTAAWLSTVRVSQDGWAEVLERVTRDLSDLAAAMDSGKIVSHISDYRQRVLQGKRKQRYTSLTPTPQEQQHESKASNSLSST